LYNDIYALPKPKAHVTFIKLLVAFNILMATLVIPALGITYYQNRQESFIENQSALAQQVQTTSTNNTTGRVAGVSTSNNAFKLPLVGTIIDLNSSSGLLIVVGIGLLGISMILLLFLIVDNVKIKKVVN
jgi:hypothetical protein